MDVKISRLCIRSGSSPLSISLTDYCIFGHTKSAFAENGTLNTLNTTAKFWQYFQLSLIQHPQ